MLVPGEPLIQFRGVRKEYANGTVAVGGLDLDVFDHELLTLVGPSGCGKSTILRMVNRLVEPSAGQILLNGKDVTESDPVVLRRDIGYAIQHVGLFPHRTVAQNVATVPTLWGWDKARTGERVDELLDLVGLKPEVYAKRFPHELSGGERQRVGVARALATDPPVLLMDEPFGAVDPEGRRRLQDEFRRIQQRLGTTVMLVTHDIDEAVSLGDRVAVFSTGGVLEQIAEPATLLAHPANATVERFIGVGRAVRLLSVGRIGPEDLEVPDPSAVGLDSHTHPVVGSPGGAPQLKLGVSLEEALSRTVLSGSVPLAVHNDSGDVVGHITSSGIMGALHRLHEASH